MCVKTSRQSMITLTHQEIEFMLSTLLLRDNLREALVQLELSIDKSITDGIADELRDLCTVRLDTHGFDANYDPTKEGKQLEVLYVG